DGHLLEARSVALQGPLPSDGPLSELAADLLERVRSALEERAQDRSRAEDAASLLKLITPQNIERSPRLVREWIDTLLTDYDDVFEVKSKRKELLDYARSVRAPAPPPTEAEFQARFEPRKVELKQPSRVRLEFRFDAARAGAWESGDW